MNNTKAYRLALKDILDKAGEIEWGSIGDTAKACQIITRVVKEVKEDANVLEGDE